VVQAAVVNSSLASISRFAEVAVDAYVEAGGSTGSMTIPEMRDALITLIEPSARSVSMPWLSPISLWSPRRIEDSLVLFPGVATPSMEIVMPLLEAVYSEIRKNQQSGQDVKALEIGCGTGVISIEIAEKTGLHVDCVDIKRMAVVNTRVNASYRNVEEMIQAWQSDGLKNVSRRYDLIIFNAPSVAERGSKDINAHDADGNIIRGVFERLLDNLRAGGELLLTSVCDISRYMPSTLTSEVMDEFMVSGLPFAIHSVKVK